MMLDGIVATSVSLIMPKGAQPPSRLRESVMREVTRLQERMASLEGLMEGFVQRAEEGRA